MRRAEEAWERGATEICLQGGIHPAFDGDYYVSVVRAIKDAVPELHVHAFSALEIWQGAATLGVPLRDYLERLRDEGLASLPGTAAEVLDDEVRAVICPDKITTAQWLEVHETAHAVGPPLEQHDHVRPRRRPGRVGAAPASRCASWRGGRAASPSSCRCRSCTWRRRSTCAAARGPGRRWARRCSCTRSAGSRCTRGSTNVQVSWVKAGPQGAVEALRAGVNDLGGTLMNESISRAAGSEWGQEMTPGADGGADPLRRAASRASGRRSTATPPAEQVARSFGAAPLAEPWNPHVSESRLERPRELVRPQRLTRAAPGEGGRSSFHARKAISSLERRWPDHGVGCVGHGSGVPGDGERPDDGVPVTVVPPLLSVTRSGPMTNAPTTCTPASVAGQRDRADDHARGAGPVCRGTADDARGRCCR